MNLCRASNIKRSGLAETRKLVKTKLYKLRIRQKRRRKSRNSGHTESASSKIQNRYKNANIKYITDGIVVGGFG